MDNSDTLNKAIELLNSEDERMRQKAASVIGSLALDDLTDPKPIPRLFELLSDDEVRGSASFALKVLADKGVFTPSESEQELLDESKIPKVCPYCNNPDVMEVLCYSKGEEVTVPSPVLVQTRSVAYVKTEDDHVFFHYAGMRNREIEEPHKSRARRSLNPGFQYLYWQCPNCLRTWSPVIGDKVAKDCPKCGMRTFVPVIFGLPDGPLFAASKRNEAMVGGCIMSGNDQVWRCTECGCSIEFEGDS